MGETIESSIPSSGGTSTAVTFVLVGAGAMLSSYCRLTYSLVVIMCETTSSINIFLPMFLGVMMARVVGDMISPSLYDRALRMKQMPFLRDKPPKSSKYLKACQIMATNVISLPTIANMDSCRTALYSPHNSFPVLNSAGRLVGTIPKSILVRLLELKAFYTKNDSATLKSTESINR